MNPPQPKPMPKKDNPFLFNYKKSNTISDDKPNPFEDDIEPLEPLEPIKVRSNRSNSHFVFQFRPEHVPKLKPKRPFVNPTPMHLCLKSIKEIDHNTYNLNNPVPPCLSCPESEDEENKSLSDISTEETITNEPKPNNNNILIQRKELMRIRSRTITNDTYCKAKDSESLKTHEKQAFKKAMEEDVVKEKKNPFFTKAINNIIQQEKKDVNAKRMTLNAYSIKNKFSILNILEASAEENNKKMQDEEKKNNDNLGKGMSRMKRSSTLM